MNTESFYLHLLALVVIVGMAIWWLFYAEITRAYQEYRKEKADQKVDTI